MLTSESYQSDTMSPDSVRAAAMTGLASVSDFAIGVGKSKPTMWAWIKQGLPVVRYGKTAYVDVQPALEWLRNRGRRRDSPPPRRPGRPSRKSATA